MHPAVSPGRGHHRRAPARQEDVLQHPQGHQQRHDRSDAGQEVVLAEPAEEAQQPEADHEVRDPHRPDVERSRTEQATTGVERRTAVSRDGVDERQRVRGKQDEQGERAGIEAVCDAGSENRRDRQAAERGRLERDGNDVRGCSDANGQKRRGQHERRPGQFEDEGRRRRGEDRRRPG